MSLAYRMTDYYSLICRAVATLDSCDMLARRRIYERARHALREHLRKLPLTKSEIERERLAFEDAIRRVELKAASEHAVSTLASISPPQTTAEVGDPATTDDKKLEPTRGLKVLEYLTRTVILVPSSLSRVTRATSAVGSLVASRVFGAWTRVAELRTTYLHFWKGPAGF